MFCLNYYPFQKYLQDAEQLKIKYRAADRTLEDFLEKYKNKSIVIKIQSFFEETDAVLLKGLSDKYQNIKLIIDFDNKYTLSVVTKLLVSLLPCPDTTIVSIIPDFNSVGNEL